MTATLDAVTSKKKDRPEPTAEQQLAEELVARARAALDQLAERWGQRYGAIIRLWENS